MKKIIFIATTVISFNINAQAIIKAKSETTIDLMKMETGPDDVGTYNQATSPVEYYTVKCSSTLPPEGKITYDANNLNDAKMETAWAEGDKEYGVGTTIEFTFNKDESSRFLDNSIINGYYKTQKGFSENSRVKKMKIYYKNSVIGILDLNDFRGIQTFPLDKVLPNKGNFKKNDILKFEIMEVYPGTKFKDVLITEFHVQ